MKKMNQKQLAVYIEGLYDRLATLKWELDYEREQYNRKTGIEVISHQIKGVETELNKARKALLDQYGERR